MNGSATMLTGPLGSTIHVLRAAMPGMTGKAVVAASERPDAVPLRGTGPGLRSIAFSMWRWQYSSKRCSRVSIALQMAEKSKNTTT